MSLPHSTADFTGPGIQQPTVAQTPSPGRRFFWLIAFLFTAVVFSSGMKAALRPPEGAVFDFFKEWAAVQNWRSEMPLYTPQRTAIRKHLGVDLATESGHFDPYNTHPPTANLFAIPFGWLSYRNAQFAWNLASLCLLAISLVWIARELDVRIDGTTLLATATLLLASDPLIQSLLQGQPNLLLGFLLVAAWRADRHGHAWLSGTSLAIAATIKLYPAFLFLYPLARRDWKSLAGGAIVGLAITALTVGIFGIEAYRDYVQTVLPEIRGVTNNWGNASLLAFWERLFGEPVSTVTPIMTSPITVNVCVWSSWLAVTAFAGWRCWQARSRSDRDAAFAIVILAMLLVSPTTWHHYFVLAAIPVCVALTGTSSTTWKRTATWAALAALTIAPRLVWLSLIRVDSAATSVNDAVAASFNVWQRGGRVAAPWQSLTALSYQMYALLLLMAVLWLQCSSDTPLNEQQSKENNGE